MMDLEDIERVRADLRFRGAQGTTGELYASLSQHYLTIGKKAHRLPSWKSSTVMVQRLIS